MKKYFPALTLKQSMLTKKIMTILIVFLFGSINYFGISSLLDSFGKINHAHTVIEAASEIEKLAIELETGQRGFLITGNESFLRSYNSAKNQLNDKTNAIKALVSDNPEQVQHMENIKKIIDLWLEKAGQRGIDERRKVLASSLNTDYLQAILKENTGKQILDKLREHLQLMADAFKKSHNLQAVNLTLSIAKDMLEMETGVRGFLITGEEPFLDPFHKGKVSLVEHLDQLNGWIDVSYNREEMVQSIRELEELILQWQQKTAKPELALRINVTQGKADYADLQRVVASKAGKNRLDNIREQLKQINAHFIKSEDQVAQNLILAIGKDMVDQETGLRGFLITGQNEFLDPFEAGQLAVEQDIADLKFLVQNTFAIEPMQRAVNDINMLSSEWLTKAGEPKIAVRNEMNSNPTTMLDVIRLLEQKMGEQVMDDILLQLGQFKQVEKTLLDEKQDDSKSTADAMLWLVLAGTLIIVAFAVALMKTTNNLQEQSEVLKQERSKLEGQDWVKTSYANIIGKLQGLKDLRAFAEVVMNELVPVLDAQLGLFYSKELADDNHKPVLKLLASYAHKKRKNVANQFLFGEGLVGQSALEQKTIFLSQVPDDYIRISSGVGEANPKNIIVFPLLFEEQLLAVIEIASVKEFSLLHQELIEQFRQNLGVVFNNILSLIRAEQLLQQSKIQAETLQTQQEALQFSNESLQAQTERLKTSEEELQQQSEELRVSNEELEEKQQRLEQQKQELQQSKNEIELKARDLSQASKYKTEFLANMSHELRTPLNSLLILSKMLAENKEGNLTDNQLEDAQVIFEGGNDLLNLINDIMDLSKVEAGMLDAYVDDVYIDTVVNNLQKLFAQVAEKKGTEFVIDKQPDIPTYFRSDGQRLEQILKNFLSNAFKFTEKGRVTLKFHRPDPNTQFINKVLNAKNSIALSVIDTGIGISADKRQAIFEAFQQEDGSTSRKYGGTGLGLTISKELTRILGGEIQLKSEKDQGSVFTLYLPLQWSGASQNAIDDHQVTLPIISPPLETNSAPVIKALPSDDLFLADDRRNIANNDKVVLIIEDDKRFAKILINTAHQNGFKCLATNRGRDGLYLCMEYPVSGIILDIGLPDIDGLAVLEQLKNNLKTRHIPVHVISGGDQKQPSLRQGALSYLQKPASGDQIETIMADIKNSGEDNIKTILVIEDDKNQQHSITRLIKADDIQLIFASTGRQACEKLEIEHFDCVILDLGLPDISGYTVLEKIASLPSGLLPPVIVYTGQEISDEQQKVLAKFTADIIIKGAESPERLLDDVSLFLHSVETSLPKAQKKTIRMLHNADAMLKGRRLLLVDDDMRNVFALTRQLEDVGMEVTMADNGQVALDKLSVAPDGTHKPFDLVIMDIMMPVMDGYEAMRKIRKLTNGYANIPIIALTAKAMPEDKSKCIEAGASEFLTKPVELDKLMSILRVWLYKSTKH
ncbi:two-component system sensor histidine kinase/response regulator [Psychromonas sp. MB-3u-54]|uniref:CHASE3 domain-containing protein n=1 Tax=Psychromonas sp. MB-3u-54 TaxID=2058319 RepID=UPI000C34CB41|nr:CHASE3 domain-containing protein [Psychromonas sp. MB-3u-54]PKH02646.1 two-component system sensor histidine kinase/response regulator [Psychromonas sp. MB-3u-54]